MKINYFPSRNIARVYSRIILIPITSLVLIRIRRFLFRIQTKRRDFRRLNQLFIHIRVLKTLLMSRFPYKFLFRKTLFQLIPSSQILNRMFSKPLTILTLQFIRTNLRFISIMNMLMKNSPRYIPIRIIPFISRISSSKV